MNNIAFYAILIKPVLYLKTRYVQKILKKKGIKNQDLEDAIEDVLSGKAISLGANLYKVRVKDKHRGKSGSFRTIWFWKKKEMVILCHFFFKKCHR